MRVYRFVKFSLLLNLNQGYEDPLMASYLHNITTTIIITEEDTAVSIIITIISIGVEINIHTGTVVECMRNGESATERRVGKRFISNSPLMPMS